MLRVAAPERVCVCVRVPTGVYGCAWLLLLLCCGCADDDVASFLHMVDGDDDDAGGVGFSTVVTAAARMARRDVCNIQTKTSMDAPLTDCDMAFIHTSPVRANNDSRNPGTWVDLSS